MTNIKKAIIKIQKAISKSTSPTKTKKVIVDAPLPTPEKHSIRKISAEEHRKMIANNAYYRAERRNFTSGYEKDDWLAAEAEVNSMSLELKQLLKKLVSAKSGDGSFD
ncbi:MAG: DUF2934 domain-containing protein [Methylotenera sp.]